MVELLPSSQTDPKNIGKSTSSFGCELFSPATTEQDLLAGVCVVIIIIIFLFRGEKNFEKEGPL